MDRKNKNLINKLAKYNYRICFEDPKLKIDYPDTFYKCSKYFKCLDDIYSLFQNYTINKPNSYIWHHFEPYVELTIIFPPHFSLYEINNVMDSIKLIIKGYKYKIISHGSPKNGFFADWYYTSYQEALFGIQSMDLTAKLAMLFWKYNDAIAKGKGKDRMLMRRFHVLSNQLAYSYVDEARVLNLRSIFSGIASTGIDQKKAVKLYEHITKMKY